MERDSVFKCAFDISGVSFQVITFALRNVKQSYTHQEAMSFVAKPNSYRKYTIYICTWARTWRTNAMPGHSLPITIKPTCEHKFGQSRLLSVCDGNFARIARRSRTYTITLHIFTPKNRQEQAIARAHTHTHVWSKINIYKYKFNQTRTAPK